MTTSPAPATDRAPWRRTALASGAVATAAWLGLLLLVVLEGRAGAESVTGAVFALAGLFFSFVTTFLLRRMWSGPAYEGGPPIGRLLALAFEILIALAILLNLVPGLEQIQVLLAWTAVACFLAAFVLALPRPVGADED